MENKNENLIAALQYHDAGFSVIPVAFRDKKPLANWQQYQKERASKEQLEHWFKNPEINIGVVTGAISGVVVVDVDTMEKIDKSLPPTATTRTGRGGWHYFYKHPGKPVKTLAGIIPGVDIRGDGGYVVMPPSIHPNGNSYEWVIRPEDGLAELPQWVFEEKPAQPTSGELVLNGTRNSTATKIAGKLLGRGTLPPELMVFAWEAMKKWNEEKCDPPLEEKELRRTFDSIFGREVKKRSENEEPREIKAMLLSELLAMEFPTPQWLVDKLIPHEAVTIISGAPASYKTFITIEIALKVASGEKVFGEFQTSQCPVLIVDEENNPRVLQERAKLLSKNQDAPIYIASKSGFLLGEKSVQGVVDFAKSKNVGLVIFDSFICIHDADENVASDMRNVMRHLKEIANNGIAVIVIHHHRKKGKDRSNASQDIRGSSDIVAQVDCHLAVDRKPGNATVTIQQSKLREAPEMATFTVKFQSDGTVGSFEYAGSTKVGQSKRSELKSLIKSTLEVVNEPPNRGQLWLLVQKAGTSGGEATFKTALKEMLAAGELFSKKGAKNSTLYSLKPLGVEDG